MAKTALQRAWIAIVAGMARLLDLGVVRHPRHIYVYRRPTRSDMARPRLRAGACPGMSAEQRAHGRSWRRCPRCSDERAHCSVGCCASWGWSETRIEVAAGMEVLATGMADLPKASREPC